MQVILTHEQSDFDAVASLLGASLLNEHALPALPRRLNRNVQAFINFYGIELPFHRLEDLPGQSIDSVILVDTQSLPTLRGMSDHMQVHVFDHHPLRSSTPKQWKVHSEKLGATTTIFVEQLCEHSGGMNVVHASLLLLGIYEDTGSLTYESTTPRDIRAAAALLERGANLRIVSEYLNPPLSPEQRVLYDQLLNSLNILQINNQQIAIAQGTAREMNEEISSVAHKLRDLIDPDALFILVSTKDGIRMVARSSTPHINVARIAAHFNGGGHDRASAALITQSPPKSDQEEAQLLESALEELLRVLPDHVNPPISVGQIMSARPLVISPETSVQDAAQIMQRYGYEGYPVVKDNLVIGLLNRRAVDRAISHKLELNAGSLMEAGNVFVYKSDSLEELQRVMTDSGWGQVPVISRSTREIIGIVTRTDLLKTMTGGRITPADRRKMAARLESALPPARLALLNQVAQESYQQKTAVYIVGGFVRDLLLNRPSLDFDIVVEGNAIALARALVDRFGGRIISHRRFGTAKWWLDEIREPLAKQLSNGAKISPEDLPLSLDLISARTEFYNYPTALPTVERSSIKLDLHRRDFTINTLALRLDGHHYGELYDYWGGLPDLQRGVIRVLHSLSFIDDPTRMLRAVRFEQRFEFHIDNRTRQLMEEARDMLRQVTGHRLRHELDLMLSESRPDAMLARLQSLELLQAIQPDLSWSEDLAQPLRSALQQPIAPIWELENQPTGSSGLRQNLAYLVWLGRIEKATLEKISHRLRFTSQLHKQIIETSLLNHDLEKISAYQPSQVVARLESLSRSSLYAVYLLNPHAPAREYLVKYITQWSKVQALSTGHQLRQAGLNPGPVYKKILISLRNAWLDGQISTPAEEQELLSILVDSAHKANHV
jgi:tRNA nucleotidyltransferase (CCA-adding enzyme)